MRELIIEILSDKIDSGLVTDLVDSYVSVKDSHILGDDESAISKSGKFVENVFRVLKYIKNKKILPEIKSHQFVEISEELRNLPSSTYPDSIRLLIPKISLSIIYETRSKSGAVHVKKINPDFIDGKFVVGICDWVMAELLRQFYSRDPLLVFELIQKIVKESIPVIQIVGDEKFVTAKLDCETDILLRLFESENGLDRKEIGIALKLYFTPQKITSSLKKLTTDRAIFPIKSGKFVISDLKRPEIKNLIFKLTKH